MLGYATWKLDWTDPQHGTGPEATAAAQGVALSASMFVSPDEYTGAILGYVLSGAIQPGTLDKWHVTELSQAEALAFAQGVAANAYLLPDGVITIPPRDDT